ncbi:MAG: pyrroline-5-carboxylate reductase [Clostridia bacterium]|nr:pyrroline-5-carboxylate reductase [Clostridia bacterium]MBR2908641.1 pyrroline-5-carboxylate reductase [Clostridia bacterium]
MKYTLGFIGCGNMGGALARAAAKTLQGAQIAVCDRDETKTEALKSECGVVPTSARDIAENAAFVVLGLKPQYMESGIAEFADVLSRRKGVTVVTMAAGLSVAAIRSYIGAELPVIRIMPNTSVAVGQGMILYTVDEVGADEESVFLGAFAAAGRFDRIPETLIDAGSALSGCGPAFVYLFAEALADGAVECGVPRDKAAIYAAQTLLGAAEMLLEYGHPGDLKDAVCSPGGTTIAGVHALERGGMRNAAMDAVLSAYKRTLELKK